MLTTLTFASDNVLVVTRLTVTLCEISCVYYESHCDIQPWPRAAHPY